MTLSAFVRGKAIDRRPRALGAGDARARANVLEFASAR
jgi:hypothetical protein